MKGHQQSQFVIEQLVSWAEPKSSIRAMLLTSNRANPKAHIDKLSDYDVILVVKDIHPFYKDRTWLDVFGKVLVTYWDDIYLSPAYGLEAFSNVIQYEDLRIDFTLWPIGLLRKITKSEQIPPELDVGYRVLLDKDGLTTNLISPTYTAYTPEPPSNTVFQKVIEDFLSVAPHLAKCLWRDELLPAKWCLDYDMKHNFLRQMLEWRVELEHNWSLPTGAMGRGLKKQLPPEVWDELEHTYVGADMAENWEALLRTLALFRELALEVADSLGFNYPEAMHQGVVRYVEKVKAEAATG